jgi:homoserine kinase type II
MAVYTDVSDADLSQFLSGFSLGRPTGFKGIAEGVENSNYLLQTESGTYILTLYEKRVSERDLPFFLNCLRHLSAQGIACPQPVADREGRVLHTVCGRPAALMTFLPGLSPRRPDAAQCGEAGSALARLHLAGASFPERRANSMGLEAWRALGAKTAPRADSVSPGLADAIAEELAFLAGQWPGDLPQGLIHADLFPDNVLFTGARISGVIDFYFACTGLLAYDVAVCLNAWCFEPNGDFSAAKSRALMTCYQALRPLTAAERQRLPVLCRAAALRFLLTRLADWLDRDPSALVRPKDPLEFLGRLRFHRQVRDSSVYGAGGL